MHLAALEVQSSDLHSGEIPLQRVGVLRLTSVQLLHPQKSGSPWAAPSKAWPWWGLAHSRFNGRCFKGYSFAKGSLAAWGGLPWGCNVSEPPSHPPSSTLYFPRCQTFIRVWMLLPSLLYSSQMCFSINLLHMLFPFVICFMKAPHRYNARTQTCDWSIRMTSPGECQYLLGR